MTVPSDAAPALSNRAAFRLVFPGVMVAMFLAAADQTILAAALPAIAADLGGLAEVSWVVSGYLLTAAIVAPIYGRVGDHYGRRRLLLVALAIFAVASLWCALATSLPMLIVGRALQGAGGGGLMTLAQAMLGEHIAPRDRGRYQGYFAAVFALASTLGPVFGGYLTQQLSWRSVFIVNLPLVAIAALLALRVPLSPREETGRFRLDYIGVTLFAASTVALLYGLSSFGHRGALHAGAQAAAIAGAAAGFVALVRWELRTPVPIIPVRLLAQPVILHNDLAVLCFAGSIFPLVLYLPLYLQLGRGFAIGASGLLLLPITLSLVAGSMVTGWRITRSGNGRRHTMVGLALTCAGLALLAGLLPWLPLAGVVALAMCAAFGLGHVMPAAQFSVQDAAGRASLGAAVGSISLSRSIGGAIGSALVGGVLFTALGRDPDLLAAVDVSIRLGVAALDAAQRSALATQLDTAFRAAFVAIAAIAGAGAIIATRIPKQAK